jgi:hypothetical protein
MSGGRPALLEMPVHHWECPSCERQSITREVVPRPRLHECAGLAGLSVPMVPAGTRAEHRTREREDYIGRELVRLDGRGRPVMAVETHRDDGAVDAVVFAPTATTRT